MKIHQLPQGTRFEYQGQTYVKTGPMLATGPSGQRFIPKYAILRSLDEPNQVAPQETVPTVDKAEVLKSFECFYAACLALLPPEQHASLQAAREQFLATLNLCSQ